MFPGYGDSGAGARSWHESTGGYETVWKRRTITRPPGSFEASGAAGAKPGAYRAPQVILRGQASTDDHQGTLAWLDSSLEWARSTGRTRLVKLLNLVRAEVLFDAGSSGRPAQTRDRAGVSATIDANRGAQESAHEGS